MFASILTMLGSQTFWTALAAIGAIVTLYFIYRQIAITKNITAYEFLRKEDDRFTSQEMRADRARLAKLLISCPDKYPDIDECADYVIGFFEDLGLLLRKKIAPEHFVWTMNCYYVLRYWEVTKHFIEWARRECDDPTYYSEFEYLYGRMLKFEGRRIKKKVEFSKTELRKFLEDELQIKLRPFQFSDLDPILQIEKSSFDEVDAYKMPDFLNLYKEYPEGFIVAEQLGQVVGYGIGYISNNTGELDSIAVDPNFRRLGIGQKLILFILQSFREKDVTTVTAEVRTTNEPAIRFHEKLGFRIGETLKQYYADGGNAYLLRMDIKDERRLREQN